MNDKKLLLTYYNERRAAFLLENDRLIQVMLASDSPYSIGDIYVGRIKNIIKGMDAAFVELSPGNVGFLPFSHFNPKTILNRSDAKQFKCGDEILVQVIKEPHKTKEVTLTTDISFSGKTLVLTPFSQGIHYSKKFDTETKERLRNDIMDIISKLSGNTYGLIVRTNAGDVSADVISEELHVLYKKAEEIIAIADKRTVFSCLYKETSFFEHVLKQNFVTNEIEIITDTPEVYDTLSANTTIRFYQDNLISLQNLYGLDEKINEALSRKVWLKCGGYLVIEPTEALTVIDVNSGKTQNKLSPEEFHHKVNCDAAKEIMRQLRLRNISGIVIVDFLKNNTDYNNQILELLKKEASKDPIQTVVVGTTALGLVEITRKKTEASLYEKLKKGTLPHET